MEFLFTCDPSVIIVHRTYNIVVYFSLPSQTSWTIFGQCSLSGSCIEGAINPDLRPPNERLDCPVRPEIECKGCPLRGLYL